jgi:hypothetical protein
MKHSSWMPIAGGHPEAPDAAAARAAASLSSPRPRPPSRRAGRRALLPTAACSASACGGLLRSRCSTWSSGTKHTGNVRVLVAVVRPCLSRVNQVVYATSFPCRDHRVLCYAMLCHAVPCRAVACRAVPCWAVPCRAVPCCAVLCNAQPCNAMQCDAMRCEAHAKHYSCMQCCAMLCLCCASPAPLPSKTAA